MKRIGILVAAMVLAACAATSPPPSFDDPSVPPPPEFAHIPFFEKGEGLVPPKVLHRVEPRPPRELRESVMKASARVDCVIDENGKVIAAWYVNGHREWAKIVIASVRQWRFQPATRDGQPFAVRFSLTSRLRTSY